MSSQRFILITGGARSGKSSFAEHMALSMARDLPVLFVATAIAGDEEMRLRISRHRQARPDHWVTLEEPQKPAWAIARHVLWPDVPVMVLDCVTILISNILTGGTKHEEMPEIFDEDALTIKTMEQIDELIATYDSGSSTFLLVTNEVGSGLVPPYPLGRIYRDVLGKVNMHLAAVADEVYYLVAGIPMQIKNQK